MVEEGEQIRHGGAPVRPEADPESYDRLRRRVLWSLPGGLYLMGTTGAAGPHVMSTSWFTQVATRPKLVAAGVEADSLTAENLAASGHFLVSLLAVDSRPLVRKFAKRSQTREDAGGTLRIEGIAFGLSEMGNPYPLEAMALIEAAVRQQILLGSHVLFIGEVTDVALLREGERALAMADTRLNYGG
ncbi:MAG: flavin reductase family protein [Actinomycetota bacterium]|nr:flavin reductase family protein [Actinomycetota bacterium]